MASSGNFNTNKYATSSNGTIGLNLSWSITSQSTANNTSTIHWVLKSNGTMSSGYFVKGGPITVTIGGKQVLNITSRINVNGSGGFSRSGNITITHDENGDKSVSMSVKAALYSYSVNCTGSKTYALTHIDRYALIESATDFTNEDNPIVVYANPAGSDITSNIHVRLKWLDGESEVTTAWSPMLSDDGGTYTFNISSNERVSMLQSCSNSNTLSVTVDLISTMNGTQYHDTKIIAMNIVNANPIITNIEYMDSDATISNITGDRSIIVQNLSILQISMNASGVRPYTGAVLVSSTLSFCDLEIEQPISQGISFSIFRPSYVGTNTATITVTDSRGNKSSSSIDITIIPWSPPSAQNTIERVNGFETDTILTVDGTISTVPGNTMSITERHRIVNGTWSSSSSVADNTPTTLSLDNTEEWEVEVTVSDSFTSDPRISSNPTVYTLMVGKGIPIMFIDTEMTSVGINGFPDDDDQLYVGGNIKATGELAVGDAASTRTNLGIGCTSLLNSPLSSGSTTINASGYNMLLFIGKGGSQTPSQTILVPVNFLTSSEQSFSFTHGYNNQYTYFYLSISNSIVTIRYGGSSNSGSIQAVFGIN